MGLFSSIVKGIKNIFKGVKKVVKKVFKGIKKFAKSKLGKVLLTAAAIYVGGGMLGAWNTPTWLGGAGTATSTLGMPAGGITATGAGTGGLTVGAEGGSLLGAAGAMPEIATAALPAATAPTVAAATAPAVAAAPSAFSDAALFGAEGLGGSQVVAPPESTGILNWMQENPALTIAGAQGLSAAVAPDPYDEWRKRQEYLRDRSNIAGVSGDGSGKPIGMGLIRQGQQQDLYTPTYTAPARG